MQALLTNKLHQYISENNPDLLVALEEKNETTLYLNNKLQHINGLLFELTQENKPEYIIEEVCMNALTKDLRPSKYIYVRNILEEDFKYAFYNFKRLGVLIYEIINIINFSEDIFKEFEFTEENEDSRVLRYAVTGIISEYLSK
ncbi:MAG TPA: hypothetical protein VFW07_15515 [Parafilimonas sp.]|nr:hypothetical protein [Parafilimonas sp.]